MNIFKCFGVYKMARGRSYLPIRTSDKMLVSYPNLIYILILAAQEHNYNLFNVSLLIQISFNQYTFCKHQLHPFYILSTY